MNSVSSTNVMVKKMNVSFLTNSKTVTMSNTKMKVRTLPTLGMMMYNHSQMLMMDCPKKVTHSQMLQTSAIVKASVTAIMLALVMLCANGRMKTREKISVSVSKRS